MLNVHKTSSTLTCRGHFMELVRVRKEPAGCASIFLPERQAAGELVGRGLVCRHEGRQQHGRELAAGGVRVALQTSQQMLHGHHMPVLQHTDQHWPVCWEWILTWSSTRAITPSIFNATWMWSFKPLVRKPLTWLLNGYNEPKLTFSHSKYWSQPLFAKSEANSLIVN